MSTWPHSNAPRKPLADRLAVLAASDPEAADLIRANIGGATQAAEPRLRQPDPASLSAWAAESDGATPDIVVCLGADARLMSLLELLPSSTRFILMEYDPARAAAFFADWPIEDHVASGRLLLAIGSDASLVENRFMRLMSLHKAPAVRLVYADDTGYAAEQFYTGALKRVRENVHLGVFNLNTLLFRGPQWQHNSLCNLPLLVSSPGVNALKQMFTGKPAIVAGAGPSLTEAIPAIREARNGFVLIATGTALRPLRNAGIRPDLVVVVDASVKTEPQFKTRCDDLFLACSSIVHPPAPPRFRGIFSAQLDANPIDRWLRGLGADKGSLAACGTVTASAIDLATLMGCNPVISVGFDLSFTDDGMTHAANTMYHGHKMDPAMLVRVPGNYKPEVLTSEQFRCYILLMRDYVATRPGTTFINATSGGARLDGMKLIRPEEIPALAGPCSEAYETIAALHASFNGDLTDKVLAELEPIRLQLADICADAQLAAMACNQLIMLLRAPCKGDEAIALELLDSIKQIDEKFASASGSSAILEMSLWPIAYQTSVSDQMAGEERLSKGVLANKRSRELYEQIAGAAKWTGHLLESVTAQMRKRMEARAGATSCRAQAAPEVPPALEPVCA